MPSSPPFCSIEPTFPQKAYFFLALYKNIHDKNCLLPGPYIHQKKAEGLKIFLDTKKAYEKDNIILNNLAIFPEIKLEKLIPLKREHWKGKHKHCIPNTQRLLSFELLLTVPSFYYILTVPEAFYRKRWYHRPAIVIPVTTSDKELDELITNLDICVDETANAAALYCVTDFTFYKTNERKWFTEQELVAIGEEMEKLERKN